MIYSLSWGGNAVSMFNGIFAALISALGLVTVALLNNGRKKLNHITFLTNSTLTGLQQQNLELKREIEDLKKAIKKQIMKENT